MTSRSLVRPSLAAEAHPLTHSSSSVVSQRHTRVDTEDLLLWRSMGLPLDEAGYPRTDVPTPGSVDVHHDNEQTALRALLRLLCKVVNCKHGTVSSTLSPAEHEAQWTRLHCAFDAWLERIPPSFQPDAILKREVDSRGPVSDIFAEEIWFTSSTCAFAMIHYHMARIILLMCGPSNMFFRTNTSPRSNFELMGAYRALEQKLRNHAKAILSIVLGTPDDSLRIHLLQPLYTAGQCLTEKSDQCMIVEMIRSIEQDLGIMSEDRVKDLVEGWGMAYSEEIFR